MKNRVVALSLALCLSLSSCASMLDRSYSSVTPHVDKPTTAKDSTIQVTNYSELVSAIHYLVSQRAETGTIRFCDYSGELADDLDRACAEVATQDPVAAYAVDYIHHAVDQMVSYDQAELEIRYQRTMEQMRSMVSVTGTGAIRSELQQALAEFENEVVLQVDYFSQDETSIAEIIQQIYEEDPTMMVGCPGVQINLYPQTGQEKVIEVLFTWVESAEVIQGKRNKLCQQADEVNGTLELTQVLYCFGNGSKEPRWVIRLQTEEGKRLYYDPRGRDKIYTWPTMEQLGYRLPETP